RQRVGEAVEVLIEAAHHGVGLVSGAEVGMQHGRKPHRAQHAAGDRAVPGLGVAGHLVDVAVLDGGAVGQVGVVQHVVTGVGGVGGQDDVVGVPGQQLLIVDVHPVGVGNVLRHIAAARQVDEV